MSTKLTKTERKLVSQGATRTSKRYREADRSARLVAVPTALAVAKIDAEIGVAMPTFSIPGMGETRASALAGLGGCLWFMFAGSPGVLGTTVGLSSLVLAGRGA